MSFAYTAVHRGDRYPHGECYACGVRPAQSEGEACRECKQEGDLGRQLPKVHAGAWAATRIDEAAGHLQFWSGLRFHWFCNEQVIVRSGWLSGWEIAQQGRGTTGLPQRRISNYVPRGGASDNDGRYLGLGEDEVAGLGEIKMFAQIARDGLEMGEDGFVGQDLLGVLKADVDRLGAIFSQGVKQPSLGMIAGLSRRMDYFFTGYLPELLRTEPDYQSTYSVYAGGDDLLLIGPWRQMTKLLLRVREDFGRWTGGNPHITLSAGLELVHENEPLNRSAQAAEERLERAKEAKGGDRNHVCAISGEPVTWEQYADQLAASDQLSEHLRKGTVGLAFLYRMLGLDEDRMHVQRAGAGDSREPLRMERAAWRARWSYQLVRNIRENANLQQEQKGGLEKLLQGLMGLDSEGHKGGWTPTARTPITIAVYRNRSFGGRE